MGQVHTGDVIFREKESIVHRVCVALGEDAFVEDGNDAMNDLHVVVGTVVDDDVAHLEAVIVYMGWGLLRPGETPWLDFCCGMSYYLLLAWPRLFVPCPCFVAPFQFFYVVCEPYHNTVAEGLQECSRYDLPSFHHLCNPVSIKYRRAWEYAPMPLSRINISNSTLSIGDRWIVTV